jgi:hypothetical protein
MAPRRASGMYLAWMSRICRLQRPLATIPFIVKAHADAR